MKQLSPEQRDLVSSLAKRLGAIPGMKAVVLGGSHARGRAQAGVGHRSRPSLLGSGSLLDPESFVNWPKTSTTPPDRWSRTFTVGGLWVNGGAWLTIGGQRVDFIYRSLEHIERVIAEAEAGRYELHYLQQPPFGFFSATYLGEIAVCIPLFDPEARLDVLKRRVADYPEALRRAVVQDFLFMAEFTLTAFAPKVAARSDTYGTAACLTRAVNELVMALFALNRKYPINDKTALAEIAEFERAPREFGPRVRKTLAHLGASAAELVAAVESVAQLLRETIELTEGLYQPRFPLPK